MFVHEDVVQDHDLLSVHRVEVVRRWVPDQKVPVKPQVLLDVYPYVRMVPVDAGVW